MLFVSRVLLPEANAMPKQMFPNFGDIKGIQVLPDGRLIMLLTGDCPTIELCTGRLMYIVPNPDGVGLTVTFTPPK